MQCKFDSDLLHEYLDDTIEPLEKLVLEEHLKGCRSCRRQLTELKLLFWELEDADQIEVPSEVHLIHHRVAAALKEDLSTGNFSAKDLFSLQKNILDASCSFVGFVPGVQAIANQLEKNIKQKPPSLYRTLENMIKGTRKLYALRGRL